jgi:hypothetical protein
MAPRDGPDDEETQPAAAAGADGDGRGHTVEPPEDALQFSGGNADALVGDADGKAVVGGFLEHDLHVHLIGRVLDGVVDQVPDGGLQLLDVPGHHRTLIVHPLLVRQRTVVRRKRVRASSTDWRVRSARLMRGAMRRRNFGHDATLPAAAPVRWCGGADRCPRA